MNVDGTLPLPEAYGSDERRYVEDMQSFRFSVLWRLTYLLVEIPGFRNDYEWYKTKLSEDALDFEKIQEALEGLTRLGLIKKTLTGSYEMAVPDVSTGSEDNSERALHSKWIISHAVPKIDQCVYGYFHANRDIVHKYGLKIREMIKEMVMEGEKNNCTEIVGVSTALVQITIGGQI